MVLLQKHGAERLCGKAGSALKGLWGIETKPVTDCELSFLISVTDELNLMVPKILLTLGC